MDESPRSERAEMATQMTRLIDGFVVTQLLYVVAKLGVVEELADGAAPGPSWRRRSEPIPTA